MFVFGLVYCYCYVCLQFVCIVCAIGVYWWFGCLLLFDFFVVLNAGFVCVCVCWCICLLFVGFVAALFWNVYCLFFVINQCWYVCCVCVSCMCCVCVFLIVFVVFLLSFCVFVVRVLCFCCGVL